MGAKKKALIGKNKVKELQLIVFQKCVPILVYLIMKGFDEIASWTLKYDYWIHVGKKKAPQRPSEPVACMRCCPDSSKA